MSNAPIWSLISPGSPMRDTAPLAGKSWVIDAFAGRLELSKCVTVDHLTGLYATLGSQSVRPVVTGLLAIH